MEEISPIQQKKGSGLRWEIRNCQNCENACQLFGFARCAHSGVLVVKLSRPAHFRSCINIQIN